MKLEQDSQIRYAGRKKGRQVEKMGRKIVGEE